MSGRKPRRSRLCNSRALGTTGLDTNLFFCYNRFTVGNLNRCVVEHGKHITPTTSRLQNGSAGRFVQRSQLFSDLTSPVEYGRLPSRCCWKNGSYQSGTRI